MGGLDVDEGTYSAVWVDGELSVRAVKSIRYSERADVFPGFSALLNLLAPAVTSMLIKQLSHDSILNFVETAQRCHAAIAPGGVA